MDLQATSERVVEGQVSGAMWELHMAAYRWASGYAADRVVVDFGCGTGYGAAHLGRVAQKVVGIDVDNVAIDFAREHYESANVAFQREPVVDGAADVVTSFQVIEHVDPEPYLEAARRMLRPGGTFLLATPNRAVRLFSWQQPWNRWHLTEYDRTTLESLVKRWFTEVESWRFQCSPSIEQSELRRYRKMRRILLPATLPFVPETIRFRLLSLAAQVGSGPADGPSGSVTIEKEGQEGLCLAVSAEASR